MNDEMMTTINNAPIELQEKMAKAHLAHKRMLNANKQYDLWFKEQKIATLERDATLEDLNQSLARWNPETNKLDELKTIGHD